jgi:hypothetical protein
MAEVLDTMLDEEQISRLPEWAGYNPDTQTVEVPVGHIYPLIVEKAGLKKDQYGAEVARRITTEIIRRKVARWVVMDNKEEKPLTEPTWHANASTMWSSVQPSNCRVAQVGLLRIRLVSDDESWALKNLPPGNGADAGANEFAQYLAKVLL